MNNDFDGINESIKKGANLAFSNGSPLKVAIKYGNIAMTKFLIDHGAPINPKDDSPIKIAANNKNLKMVKFLESYFNNKNKNLHGSILYARHIDKIVDFFSKGINVDNKKIKEVAERNKSLLVNMFQKMENIAGYTNLKSLIQYTIDKPEILNFILQEYDLDEKTINKCMEQSFHLKIFKNV